jgi:hypothetical protein
MGIVSDVDGNRRARDLLRCRIKRLYVLTSPRIHTIYKASIVNEVIGAILFHSDDFDGLTRKRALSLLVSTDGGNFEVVINTPQRFFQLVGAVALGSSFRIAAQFVHLV